MVFELLQKEAKKSCNTVLYKTIVHRSEIWIIRTYMCCEPPNNRTVLPWNFFWVRGSKSWFKGYTFSQGYSLYFFPIFAHLWWFGVGVLGFESLIGFLGGGDFS